MSASGAAGQMNGGAGSPDYLSVNVGQNGSTSATWASLPASLRPAVNQAFTFGCWFDLTDANAFSSANVRRMFVLNSSAGGLGWLKNGVNGFASFNRGTTVNRIAGYLGWVFAMVQRDASSTNGRIGIWRDIDAFADGVTDSVVYVTNAITEVRIGCNEAGSQGSWPNTQFARSFISHSYMSLANVYAESRKVSPSVLTAWPMGLVMPSGQWLKPNVGSGDLISGGAGTVTLGSSAPPVS